MKYTIVSRFVQRDQKSTRDWTDLPLLPSIADRLALIELIRFRAVCKDWRAASSDTLDKVEAILDTEPWFILYGDDNSTCSLVTENSTKKYTIDVPELNGTICLASSQGWLLLFCEGLVFFLCVLSRAKVDIPATFPHSEISNHIAFFSAPPTSNNCIVGVLRQTETETELYMIRRGATTWTKHKLAPLIRRNIKHVSYHEGEIYFIDDRYLMVFLEIENSRFYHWRVNYSDSEMGSRFRREGEKKLTELLALDDMSQVSICGTYVPFDNFRWNKTVRYQNSRVCKKQGAWFQPRFHQITQKQSW
ncbi:F-box/kelch-repeat protein At1g57790-like [Hibiscus syriacus]|uniref:F-box/kelch-repeat protein At1g57790-like n=1 Tax=Hibiscus syriacus TaxID=106335 RepID=UPI001922B8CB|nr:F-box/kelch-repeat protein At1g57790-like [Hibiscus syriacus]